MTRFLLILCAIAAVVAHFIQGPAFQASESAATNAPKMPEPERVVIDGKLYPKNPRGVYTVDGVTTFVKDDSKKVAASKAPEPTQPKAHEVVMDPAALGHLVDGQGSN